MITDKMIPIDFCRKITPFVSGDVYYNNFVDAEFTMDQQDADGFNKADPESEFNTYFIVSFASRPNTGKQPVADDVVVDRNWASKKPVPASAVCWTVFYSDETWKPNHAAMLKQYQSEQGVNTMNTHKETAHHIALQIEELGSQPQHHIDLAIAADAINDVVISPDEPVIEPVTVPEFPSDFYQKGGEVVNTDLHTPQIIETWVGDHITEQKQSACPGVRVGSPVDDLINPVSEGCQADKPLKPQDFGAIPDKAFNKSLSAIRTLKMLGYSDNGGQLWKPPIGKVPDFITEDKPVFTQEMAKHRQAAPIGSSVQTSMGEGVVIAHGVSYGRSQVVIQTNETMLSLDDSQYYPIDSRTDEDKAISDLDIAIDGRHTADVLDDIKADKITGVKWVGK